MSAIQPAAAARRIFSFIDEGEFRAARESLDVLSPQDSIRELAEAELALYQGRASEARPRIEIALDGLRRANDGFGIVRALVALAAIDRDGRRIDEAVRRLREARDVAAGLEEREVLASVLVELGTAQLEAGRPREAAESAREAAEMARRVSDVALEGAAHVVAVSALIDAGAAEDAQAMLDDAVLRFDGEGDRTVLAGLRVLQGRLLTLLDRTIEAVETLRAAVDEARSAGDVRLESHALAFLDDALEGIEVAGRSRVERTVRALRERPRTPIRRTPSNELVFSGDVLPTWTAAKRTLERFILENALKQTNNNRAAAGRMLKITKVAVHHACKRHGFGGGQ